MKTDESAKPVLDELQEQTRKLHELLEHREYGCTSWWLWLASQLNAVRTAMDRIDK